jgi:hypothetical protein
MEGMAQIVVLLPGLCDLLRIILRQCHLHTPHLPINLHQHLLALLICLLANQYMLHVIPWHSGLQMLYVIGNLQQHLLSLLVRLLAKAFHILFPLDLQHFQRNHFSGVKCAGMLQLLLCD